MNTKTLFALLCLGIAYVNTLSAQNGVITGTVSDSSFPLPGASVIVEGSTKGTTTDFDGNFALNQLPSGTVILNISYIGFKTKSVQVTLAPDEKKNLGMISLEASSEELNEILVQGGTRRNSEARALNIQKKSMSIMNVIAADGIGKLPDRNAAETVQRIQGLSIERDQGEGRYVSMRGLPPFWASTTINGNRLPTSGDETTSRATQFDFFPSELISYVQAAKAFTPDMEADGIAGGVNFITQTSPAKKTLNVNVGGGYNDKSGKEIYDASITYGDRTKDGKFGFIVNASHWNRNWASDNFEARRAGDEGVYRMEIRDYTGKRKTTGVNAAVEFNPSSTDKLFARGVYGTLNDEEIHYKHRVRFDKYNPNTQNGRVELQNIYNILITDFYQAELGGKHDFKNSTLDWALSTNRNEFKYGDVPNEDNNSYFVVKYKQDGIGFNPAYVDDKGNGYRAYWKADGGVLDFNDSDALFNYFSDPNFQMDPTQMQFADMEYYQVGVMERDNIIASVNYEHNINDDLTLKFGGKFRDKDRRALFSDDFYEWGSNSSVPYLSDMSNYVVNQPGGSEYMQEINAPISNIFGGVLSTDGMTAFMDQNQNNLVLQDYSEGLQFGSGLGRNFDTDETHASAFGMGTYNASDKLTLLGGLRATHTSTTVSGYANVDDELEKVKSTKNYWAILPMLHLKYTPKEDMNIRFAATRSFSRPNFGDITPGGTYLAADNEYKGGNPDLNPTFSWNLDLLGEYYFKNVGVVNAGVFYKSITDPIFENSFTGTYNGHENVQMSTSQNGQDAWIAGVELGLNKRFDFLPGFLKHFGTQLNATFMDSEMTMPGGRKVTTPYQANQIMNAQLFYDNDKFSARIAFNHKGKYAMEFGDKDINDFYYGKYNTMDFSASYRIGKHLMFYTDLNNILNQPLVYHYGSSEDRPAQVELYGLKGSFGVKFTL
ncbi:TonB-dependent receptor [Mangrovimonas aestuarii]|uniref:TonB-dependent receptor n=1 Tax=Mangrovimonas aestuarii TaxID=3018443 RepID=UPI00237962C1|nr:TonB-dependent receptor [Mangrovimonas aestuarii]